MDGKDAETVEQTGLDGRDSLEKAGNLGDDENSPAQGEVAALGFLDEYAEEEEESDET